MLFQQERLESTVDDGNDNIDKELGHGKRQKRPNQFYNNLFWRHNDNAKSIEMVQYLRYLAILVGLLDIHL